MHPGVSWGTARARAPHNSHNKSPRTTDARSTYKGITDQKEERRVRRGEESWGDGEKGKEEGRGTGERVRNNGVDPDRGTAAVAKGVTVASQASRPNPYEDYSSRDA